MTIKNSFLNESIMAMTSDDSEAKTTENCKAEIWPKNYFIRRVPSNIQKKLVLTL